MNRTPNAYLSLFFPLLLLGCSKADSHSHVPIKQEIKVFSGEYPINVLCTTGQVAEMVRRIGGEHLQVTALMDHSVDPHLFKPLFDDVAKLSQADIIFYNGLHLEGRMADMFVQRARKKPTYAVTEGLVARKDKRLREPPEFAGMYDPHVWHDVLLWSDCVQDVADVLGKLDPPHAKEYDENAHRYREELAKLHQHCRDEIATIPEQSRVLITAHDAFGYFGKAYDIEVFGLKGISSEEEIDLAHQEEVQQMIMERKIPAVFVESTINSRAIEALIEPCVAAGWDLQNGGELYSDALGVAGSDASTYTGMIRHNVKTIVEALAPAAE
ncbi:MAG: zinc ABC transporter solute-binding protein [Planctomycetes bacterium]|nr:zinc ABC transporter solute-binding protein [Planctomycetota bacterium]